MNKDKKVGASRDGEGATENQVPWVPQSLVKVFSRWDDWHSLPGVSVTFYLSLPPQKAPGQNLAFSSLTKRAVSVPGRGKQRRNGAGLLHEVAIRAGIHPQSRREETKPQLCPGILILADPTLGYQNRASLRKVPLTWGVPFIHRLFY